MSISAVNNSLMTALNQIYGSTGANGNSREDTDETLLTDDSVTLSSQALQLSSLFGTEPGQPITLTDLQDFADGKLKEFQEKFQALLKANGIDTSQPITLGHESGTGRLIVTNDHPEADKIEQLLDENPDLRNTFTAATSALEIARNSQDQLRFAEAYDKNPLAAVAQFGYLFNSRWDAQVTFGEDGFSVGYDQVPREASSGD